MNKRILSLTLALVMILGTFTAVFAAEQTAQEKAGAFLEEVGLLKGDDKGDLLLNENLERRDSVVLLARLLGEEDSAAKTKVDEKTPSWTDVRTDDYYVPFFAWAQISKNFEGKENNKFEPRADLTTQEYATVLLRALGHELNGKDAWKTVMELAEKNGLLENVDSKANEALKRGDMAVMTLNALSATVKGTGNTLADELNIKLPVPAKLEVVDVYADNLKEVKIELNKPVAKEIAENTDNYRVEGFKVVKADLVGNTIVLLLDKAEGSAVEKMNQGKEYKLTIDRIVDGKVTIKDTFKFKASDNALPEVVEVIGLGTKAIKVTMSEPVKSASNRDLYKLDGKKLFGSIDVKGREIFIRTFSDMEEGDHTLTVGQVEDYNGFKHVATDYSFEVLEDKEAPQIVDYVVTTNKLTVTFDEDIDVKTVRKGSVFWKLGSNKKEATVDYVSGNKATFLFEGSNELPLRDTVIYFNGIKDYSGNEMKNVELTVNADLDRIAPEVVAVELTDDKSQIKVRFSKPVVSTTSNESNYASSARNPKNYRLTDSKKNELKITNISEGNLKNEYVLNLQRTLEDNKTYNLNIFGITDKNTYPNLLVEYNEELSVTDKLTPSVSEVARYKVTAEKTAYIRIKFNKVMDTATILNPDNYLVKFDNNKVISLSELEYDIDVDRDSKYVDLSIGLIKDSEDVDGIAVLGALDLNGNKISNYGQMKSINAVQGNPALSKVKDVTNNKKVILEFDRPVIVAKESGIKVERFVTTADAITVKSVKEDGKTLELEVEGLKEDFSNELYFVTIASESVKDLDGKYVSPINSKGTNNVLDNKIAIKVKAAEAVKDENVTSKAAVTVDFNKSLESVTDVSDSIDVKFIPQNVELSAKDVEVTDAKIENGKLVFKAGVNDLNTSDGIEGFFKITFKNINNFKAVNGGNLISIDTVIETDNVTLK